MDIERLKKINQMTKELQRAGFAGNSREAFSQADSLFRPPAEESAVAPAQHNQEPVEAPSAQHAAPADFLVEKKVALLVDMHTKKLNADVTFLQAQIQQLQSELQMLRQEVRTKPAAPAVSQVAAPSMPPAPAAAPAPEKKESHPRQGDFKPGDVSIEKMFYFGKK